MAGTSSLTKDRLQQKEDSKRSTSAIGGPCKYTPLRSNQPPCTELSVSNWGFCKKHSRTVQAKRAEEKWESENTPQPPATSVVDPDADKLKGDDDAMEQLAKANARRAKPVRARVQEEVVQKTTARKKVAEAPTNVKGVRKPTIQKKVIRPNFWGRFEDTETHIVFDPTTKTAYGIQDPTGKVIALSAKHIAICVRNGWNYNAPDDDEDEEEDEEDDYEEANEEEEEGDEEEEDEDGDDDEDEEEDEEEEDKDEDEEEDEDDEEEEDEEEEDEDDEEDYEEDYEED